MRRFLVGFIRPEAFVHTRSLVDFITSTSESRFSVQLNRRGSTAGPPAFACLRLPPNGLCICGIHIHQNRNRPRPFIVRCLRRAVYTTTIKPLSMVLTCISISCYNARDAISVAKQAELGCPEMRLRMPRTNRRHARHSMTHWAGMFFVTCCREPGQGTRLRPMSGRSKPFEEH